MYIQGKLINNTLLYQTTRAEVKIANALVQHNIPLAVTDHLSPLLRDIFPDSDIAKEYTSASTKTTCMINGSLVPHFKSALVSAMKSQPFSIAVDGSNDSGLEKMNPMTVRLYDVTHGKIVTRFLDMCLTKGYNCISCYFAVTYCYCCVIYTAGMESATAESIFQKMNEVFQTNEVSWLNCVGVSVDNTSVNLGKINSIMTRVLEQNAAVYFMGCPCHIVHNTCMKAAEKFAQVCA